jgi:NADPH:quinone reductase-like Zn-dependent oxidoreductase
MSKMKAIVQDRYGSVDQLRLAEVERPTPARDEVLVRVHAASVHADVWHVVVGLPHVLRLMGAGLRRPKNPIPGTDLAGVVESCGEDVTRFRPGDEVFGETIRGMQWNHGGAFAEYATAPASALAHKPANVTFEAAAAVPTAGHIALMNLRDFGRFAPGMNVLVNGAGGGVGTIALQIAKALGARVTAVDRADKLPLLEALGADQVLDHERVDFTQGEARYDLVLDIPGNHPFSACRRVLTPRGTYVLVGHDRYGDGMARTFGQIPRAFGLMGRALFTRQLPKPSFALPAQATSMELLRELLAAGTLTPHIDRTFPLSEAANALRYLQSGQARGKIVLAIVPA